MRIVRRFTYASLFVACLHLVFGAVVRISGSGMGCGDHWPRCYGSFFPPLDRPDLIIEVTHRYLASVLLLTLLATLVVAWRHRSEAGVGGKGGVLRATGLAVTLGFSAALLGAVTVKLGNAPFATLGHWTIAMSLVATVAAMVIRAGGLSGDAARLIDVTGRARRASMAAAIIALITVVMGGLTAKYPGAAVACQSFPLCGSNPDVERAAVHVQSTHRVLAFLVVLHLIGLMFGVRRRGEHHIIRRAATIAASLGVLQILVAGAMIGMKMPGVLRSLHEATGVSIWIATFVLAYLAHRAQGGHGTREPNPAPEPDDLVGAGSVRAPSARGAFSSAVADAPPSTKETREPWQGASRPIPKPHSVAVIVARGADL